MNNTNYKKKQNVKKYIFIFSMLAYTLIHFAIFYVYVNINSFKLAFVDKIDGTWNSLANFKFFVDDIKQGINSVILQNMGNTLKYFAVNVVCQLLIAMLLAYFIYKKILLNKFFMVVFMIPMIISMVVLASIYSEVVSPSGIIGKLFPEYEYGILTNVKTATPTIIAFTIWTGAGLNLIMFSGSMSRIPEDIVESAKLEGIGFWQELIYITVPMIWPTFSMLMLLSVTSVFASTGPIILFSQGAASNISTIDFWMYVNIVKNREYNLASALGMILTVLSLPIFLFVMWIRKKLDPEITY